jgi:ribosome-binding protein aMBF1 (putative translation factor)
MRLPVGLRNRVDEWAKQQDSRPSRSEAIRRLLNLALDGERPINEAGPPLKVTSGMKNDRKAILAPERIAGFQIRAARAVLGWSAQDLARESSVSLRTIRRAEVSEVHTDMTVANERAVRRALEAAGVEFIDESGGGPGVRLRKRHPKKS